MTNKVCLVYNYAQHYRSSIFVLMDKELDVDFVFGDAMGDVKKMDYTKLHRVIEVHNIKVGPITWQAGVLKLAFKKYNSIIALGDPSFFSTWLLLLLCRFRKVRTVLWTHGWYGRESNLKAIIKKAFFRLSDRILTYGNYARELMIKAGFSPDKIYVVHNSLSYDEQVALRSSLSVSPIYKEHFNNDCPNIVFIGRLTPVKKLYMILEAQDICARKGRLFNVTFIGDGQEKKHLVELTNSLNLSDNVWFYGSTYNERDISLLLFNADICVAPGNIGLTAMHALSFGCPCISHDNYACQMPEFEAIKENLTGLFFKYNNVESLADVICEWLSRGIDREQVRSDCFKEIDTNWNPYIQIEIIKKVLEE